MTVVLFARLFCFQAEDGIRDLVRSRGLGDVYKRQARGHAGAQPAPVGTRPTTTRPHQESRKCARLTPSCLLYTSDAADERSSVDLGGRGIITKKTT